MSMIRIRPATPELIVYYPGSRERLPAGGDLVPDCIHWQRALRRGDVIVIAGAAPPLPAATQKKGA